MDLNILENVEFMVFTPSKSSFGKRYNVNINGESSEALIDRIALKNYLANKFKHPEEMIRALEEFKSFLIDIGDESITFLKESSNTKNTKTNKNLSEYEIRKINNSFDKPEVLNNIKLSKSKILNNLGSISSKGDNLWKKDTYNYR